MKIKMQQFSYVKNIILTMSSWNWIHINLKSCLIVMVTVMIITGMFIAYYYKYKYANWKSTRTV